MIKTKSTENEQYRKMLDTLDQLNKTATALRGGPLASWPGTFAGAVALATSKLLSDLQYHENITKPPSKLPSAAEKKRADNARKTKGYKAHNHEPGDTDRYGD